VAAVGSPIAQGTITILCASGNALATTTGAAGTWQISFREQALPCAVQLSGGTIGAAANPTSSHSVATAKGNVNVTPLADLVFANMVGSATPALWFSGWVSSRSVIAGISTAQVTAAVASLRTALPELTALASTHPIATSFVATPGNPGDDVLVALQTAMDKSGVTHASLLGDASTAASTAPPANFSAALGQAYASLTGPASTD
jgi:hypothetical protein